MLRARLAPWALSALVACAPRPAPPSDALVEDASRDSATSAMAVGQFRVELVRIELVQPQTTEVTAKVYSSEPPTALPLVRSMAEGECELLVPRVPFCDPRCPSGEVCASDGACRPRPALLDVGAVRIAGLRRVDGQGSSTLEPGATGYALPGESLVYPPFAAGEPVRLVVEGGSGVPGFSMEIPAIDEMTVLSLAPRAAPGEAVPVRWVPPRGEAPEGQRVLVTLDFTHHAGLRGMISCVTADDGGIEVPATLVTALHGLGAAGFPSLYVTRAARRTMRVGTHAMTFELVSEKEIYVEIPGVRSCRSPGECAPGERCRDDFTCGP